MSNLTCRLIWWALVGSQLLYVAIAHAVPAPPEAPAALGSFVAAFTVLSLAIAAGSVVYRRRQLVEPIQAGRLDPTTPAGFQTAFPPFVVNLALSESIAIYGLVLSFLSGRPTYSIAFGASASRRSGPCSPAASTSRRRPPCGPIGSSAALARS